MASEHHLAVLWKSQAFVCFQQGLFDTQATSYIIKVLQLHSMLSFLLRMFVASPVFKVRYRKWLKEVFCCSDSSKVMEVPIWQRQTLPEYQHRKEREIENFKGKPSIDYWVSFPGLAPLYLRSSTLSISHLSHTGAPVGARWTCMLTQVPARRRWSVHLNRAHEMRRSFWHQLCMEGLCCA